MSSIDELIARVLFLCGFTLLGLLLARRLRLDSSLTCLGAGVLAGLSLPWFNFDTGIRADNLQQLVFYVILPMLIFEAAWYIKPLLLRRWLAPVLILSIPGVLLVTAISGALMYIGIGHASCFPWAAALLTGAIISATDPAAVIARLRDLHAPEGLATLMESESLFNDATAVVLFGLLLTIAQGEMEVSGTTLVIEFSRSFFGGAAVGVIFGCLTASLIIGIGGGAVVSFILLIAALGSFYLAEHLLHVSGIMSVMFTAIAGRYLLLRRQTEASLGGATVTMEWLGVALNALLFTLMGLVIVFKMFTEWLPMLIAIGAGLLARTLGVLACVGASRLLGNSISLAWQAVLSWGGIRGAVAIALVLALPAELPYWWTIQSMVFGVVLFSLIVQGSSIGPLIRRLRLNQS